MQIKIRGGGGGGGNAGFIFICNFVSVKPGLHIVIAIAQHAFSHVLKRFENSQHVDCKYFL